jgi:type IV pilus assembly protein PilQ
MCMTGPARHGKVSSRLGRGASRLPGFAILLAIVTWTIAGHAQEGAERRLESIDVSPLPGQRLELRLRLNQAAPEPRSFTIDDPARISLDLADTALGLASRRQDVNLGPLSNILSAEANGRTRVVLNLNSMVPYQTRVEGDSVYVTLGEGPATTPAFAAEPQRAMGAPAPATAAARGPRAISNVDFRRGPDGAGQVIVELTDPRTTVDVRHEGGRIVVDFQNTALPASLMRRLDVTDFATPVATVDVVRAEPHSRLVVTAGADYEQLAYQSDNQFTLELKPPPLEDRPPGLFDTNREYTGERLTLNFQDIEVRAVLQLLADTSGLNIVVSDNVTGNVTLRLQNVPWDQALDIVMTTKGLDMRRNGNVMIVAPAQDIAAREQQQLESMRALQQLEPIRSEFIQVNYARAADLADLIRAGGQTALLSERGSVTVDARTNTLLVSETAQRLGDIRRMVTTLDIPVRQVLIESRVVIVNDDFDRNVCVRLGVSNQRASGSSGLVSVTGTSAGHNLPISPGTVPRYNVNLPIANPAGSIAMAILDANSLIDLELSALQAEGAGQVISSPRVITANQREARIEQGVEIPYQEAASSGATTTQFKQAVLSLTVTPQITPDDRIIMDLLVTKDSVGTEVSSATGGMVPSIDTRSVATQALVNDGETVVLGGIYETEERDTVTKVPVLGDIPGIGYVFRQRRTVNNRAELLIFVTPKILREGARVN